MKQHVVLSFYHFRGLANKFWAFKNMRLAHDHFQNIPGLSFHKVLGTGAGNGFRWYPDYTRYGILTVWENDDYYQDYQKKNEKSIFQQYRNRSYENFHAEMTPVKVHGRWSGHNPFLAYDPPPSGPIAVITRATINPLKLWSFWKTVRRVSKETIAASGRVFSVGIGEWPLIQQATFSIWNDMTAMKEFAYASKHHAEVVKKTRKYGWFTEELFARFEVLNLEGSWAGSKIDTARALGKATI